MMKALTDFVVKRNPAAMPQPHGVLAGVRASVVLRYSLSTERRKLMALNIAHCLSSSRFAFRGLDEVHGNSGHPTDNRSLGGIADVQRPAF
jgi:hypothetical protein